MRRKRVWGGLMFAVVALGAVGGMLLWNGDDGYTGRYGEIRRLILDNLQLGRHFTRATNTVTIKAVRPHVATGDVAVLARMLGDEKGTVAVAAAHLLELLGTPGEAALRAAARNPDFRISGHAQDALRHIKQCRDPSIGNLDRSVCPAAE
ncbi:MAG: hypothetical protein OEU46_06270 [Alphaproteobacteria bacterium]|nr:hypothetical protein [Alphaproteobacteria bacterium]